MNAEKVVITIEIDGKSYDDYGGSHKITHDNMVHVLDQVMPLLKDGNDKGQGSNSCYKYEYKVEEDPQYKEDN